MRILLFKHHTATFKHIKQVVKSAFPGTSFDLTDNCEQTLQQLNHSHHDLCLLDLSRSNLSNYAGLISRVTHTQTAIPILFLSSKKNYHTLQRIMCLTHHAQSEARPIENPKSLLSPMYECLPKEQITPLLIKHTCEKLIERHTQRKRTDSFPAQRHPDPLPSRSGTSTSLLSSQDINNSLSSLRVFIDNLIEATSELSSTNLTQEQLTYVNNILYDSQCMSRNVYWMQRESIKGNYGQSKPHMEDQANKAFELSKPSIQTSSALLAKSTRRHLQLNQQLDQIAEMTKPDSHNWEQESYNREPPSNCRLTYQYQSILAKKLPNFLQRSTTLLMDIQTAVLNQDAHALESAAHTFKGLATSFQFFHLAETCEELEHLAGQHDLSASESHITKLHQQLTGIHS
ncbi:Hpt domain-containing protein [Litoribrevibacter euphylliae]|uniref:Hpt domain-containing protein n=1 Tax=Litoribrevibacter euphylliae TaxID=1834034 RepID=A0ABV7HE85_9GAMM